MLNASRVEHGWPIWPPCTTNYLLPEKTIGGMCPSYQEVCSAAEILYANHRSVCGGSIYAPNNKCSGWSVSSRTDYQWVCNDCATAFAQLTDTCNGAANIALFDNDRCSGVCRDGLERKNCGPPPCEK